MGDDFAPAGDGAGRLEHPGQNRRGWGRPPAPAVLLGLIAAGCLGCGLFIHRDPAYMDLAHCAQPPGPDFWLGTDALGRDVFVMLWYGGRTSLLLGAASAALSTAIAAAVGCVSALGPDWLDRLLMRLTEIAMSVPGLLLTALLQAAMGGRTAAGLAAAVALTGWMEMAKVVRTQARQIRCSGYVEASRCMGGGFFHIVRTHLVPNVLPSIAFMGVMRMRSAILAESALSFMGLGLPVEAVSWGGMLADPGGALLGGAWWSILAPGGALAVTLLCVSGVGERLRVRRDGRRSNL